MENIIERLKKIGKSFLMLFIYIIVIPGVLYSLFMNNNFNSYSFLKQNLLMLASEFIVFLILVFLYRKTLIADFKDFKKNFKNYYKLIIKYWLIGIGIMVFINFLINFVFFKGSIAINEELNRETLSNLPLYSIITLLLFGPVSEEIIFRLNFRKSIKNETIFLIVTALLFGSMHLLAYFDTFESIANSWQQLLYLIPYSTLGFIFGYAYIKTKNIFPAICIHMLTNLLSVSIILLSI